MIRIACVLVVLAACSAPTEHIARPSEIVASCPASTNLPCPVRTYAPVPYSIPLAPEPLPLPQARDWYCHTVYPSEKTKPRTTACWVSQEICQHKRKEIRKESWGRSQACGPERVAYCLQAVNAAAMGRQFMCTRTMNDCSTLRQALIDKPKGINHVTECQPMLNTDPYDKPRDFESRRLRE